MDFKKIHKALGKIHWKLTDYETQPSKELKQEIWKLLREVVMELKNEI